MAIEAAPFTIVKLAPGEAVARTTRLQAIYRDAVTGAGSRRYDGAQVAAWASSADDVARWMVWLRQGTTWIAVDRLDEPFGFATTWPADHVHQLYVRPTWHRRGVASALLAVIHSTSRADGVRSLTTNASLLAEPVFASHGYALVAREQSPFGGQVFSRASMRKDLS